MSQAAWKIHNAIEKFSALRRTRYMREGCSCAHDVIVASHRTSVAPERPVRLLSCPPFSQVHVKVSVPKGIKFVGHPGKHHLTRKKCVAPGEATPTSIVLSVTELGSANITGYCSVILGTFWDFFSFIYQLTTFTKLIKLPEEKK